MMDDLRGWQAGIRAQFPIITADPCQVYLDSAATSQKPQSVLDEVLTYLTTANANTARGTYPWANRTTARIDQARDRIRHFVSDPDPRRSGVHFVSGTTEGLRAVARDWLAPQLHDGDEIIVPFADHSANYLPWIEAAGLLQRQGIQIRVRSLPYEAAHEYDTGRLGGMINDRTRFIAATHVHHVYGGDMNVHRLRAVAGPSIPICLDAAQSAGHLPLSAQDLDVDFILFSGHKVMALPGVGALWSRNLRGPAYMPAGWLGSPNTSGIVSLVAALDWLEAAGVDRIAQWNTALTTTLTDGLRRMPAYEILGCQRSLAAATPAQRRPGVVTFRHREISSNDLGFILASEGIMVRSDEHCQAPDGEQTSSVRVSVHVYNTPEEIDRLLTVLAELGHPE